MTRAWPVPWTESQKAALAHHLANGKSYAEIGEIMDASPEAIRSAARRLKNDNPLMVETFIVEMFAPAESRQTILAWDYRSNLEDQRGVHDLWSIRVHDVNEAWKFMALHEVKFRFYKAYRVTDDWTDPDNPVEVSSVEFDPR